MKRDRTLLLLGLGLAAAATQPASAALPPTAATSVPEQSGPIHRLARIRADYLKALIDRKLQEPHAVIAQRPNSSNFKNWAKGWRNF